MECVNIACGTVFLSRGPGCTCPSNGLAIGWYVCAILTMGMTRYRRLCLHFLKRLTFPYESLLLKRRTLGRTVCILRASQRQRDMGNDAETGHKTWAAFKSLEFTSDACYPGRSEVETVKDAGFSLPQAK